MRVLKRNLRDFAGRFNIKWLTVRIAAYSILFATIISYKMYRLSCTDSFDGTIEENLNVIMKYPRGNADFYFKHLYGNLTAPKMILKSFPVIVSACDTRFYGVIQGLLKTIHELLLPKYKDIKIIVYDIGLTKEQLQEMKTYCRCEVRQFPFHLFPHHIQRLKTYSWKPLIVKTVLMEFGWVWWMDSATRITSDRLETALNYSKINSMLFFSNDKSHAVAYHTDPATMNYFAEDACKYRQFGEFEAGFNLYHFDNVTSIVVNQWAACALNEECIAPKGSENKQNCYFWKRYDGRCHRFDQSALSIILRRLFHVRNDYPLVPIDIRTFHKGETVNYFEELASNKVFWVIS